MSKIAKFPLKTPGVILALVLGLAASGPAFAQEVRQITVTGQGIVHAVPDMATLSLGVEHQHRDASQAMAQSSAAMGAMLKRLAAFGIEPRDVQTGQVSLSPIYTHRNNSQPRIEGYRAVQSVNVRVRDLDSLGQVMGAVLQDGANRFSGLRFGVQDPAPLQDQARQAAVAEALRKAKLYAEAASVELGDILSISETAVQNVAPMMRMAADMAEAVPIAEGELNLTQSVRVVIKLD
ncbi:SIMPL domain-containing protein [Thalassovita sp.]|jgi:uncharacterized protein YggE|uniref:SIMPL domain-containing protein n=1 Tax=Thalassovita sp. TaxID=1979401 RepID=UPI003B59B8C3